jgi:ubiquitin-protein ligase
MNPSYIYSDIQNSELLKIGNILETINSNIEIYDRLEDVVYELDELIEEFTTEFSTEREIISKDEDKFKRTLEKIKKKYYSKTSNFTSKFLSYNSCIEMISDQLIRIYQEPNFELGLLSNNTVEHSESKSFEALLNDIDSLEIFTIILKNFTFKNSDELEVCLNFVLPVDFISMPPVIKINSNMILKDNILDIIEKLKPFSDYKSWSIKYSIHDIVMNIFNMINTYGEIHSSSNNNIEILVCELEYLYDIKDKNISETKLLEIFDKDIKILKSSNSDNKYWNKGTGYGHNESTEWNIEEYVKMVELKKKSINVKMKELTNFITDTINSKDFLLFCESYSNVKNFSRLVNLYSSYINNDNVDQNILIEFIHFLELHAGKFNNKLVLEETKNLLIKIKEYYEFTASDEDKLAIDFINKSIVDNKNDGLLTCSSKVDDYQKIFEDYRVKMSTIVFNNFYYSSENKPIYNLNSTQIKKLNQEFIMIKRANIISKDASVFFCVEKNNINKMRFIVTGPVNTPYSYGLFIFDMSVTSTYPTSPPQVTFINNGKKRFNPNLYDNGKVCLSLLGTWRGDKGESWNSTTSTFNQLLISIQSQILIEQPYFNEPGYEKYIGKTSGIESSKNYNFSIRQYTIDHAINDLMCDIEKYKEFEYVITNYFKYHKNVIKDILSQWLEEMPASMSAKFKASYDKFITLSSKL